MVFKKGDPGGPGRPVGFRTTANRVLDELASKGAESILKKQIELAQAGDPRAAEIVLRRVWLMPRGRPVDVDLPPIETAPDLMRAHAAVMAALAAQTITPEEATSIAAALDSQRRAIEVVDLERRVRALEAEDDKEDEEETSP
jgi:hypothetical protein